MKTYCISTNVENCEGELSKLKIKAEAFYNKENFKKIKRKGTTNEHSKYLHQHLSLLKHILKKGKDEYYLILDDNISVLRDNISMDTLITLLPKGCDVLFLGGMNHFHDPYVLNYDFYKCRYSFNSHAYIIRHDFIKTLIKVVEKRESELDVIYARLQENRIGRWYGMVDDIIISNKPYDKVYYELHSGMVRFNNICKKLHVLLPNKQVYIDKNSKKKSFLVENRILSNLEFTIKNTIYKLGHGWGHIIYCSLQNIDEITHICGQISDQIEIRLLTNEITSQNDYNKFMMDITTWEDMQCETIFIYQTDTILFKDNIDDYMMYDYIGSPWGLVEHNKTIKEKLDIDLDIKYGNGGLCLRNVEMCKYFLLNDSLGLKKKDPIGGALDNIPEDLYFSTYFHHFSKNMPSIDECYDFSFETYPDLGINISHFYNVNLMACHGIQHFINDDIEKELISKWLSNTNRKRFIFIVSGIITGGSRKFINDMVNNLSNEYTSVVNLTCMLELGHYRDFISEDDYIIFNHFVDTDIKIHDLLKLKRETNISLYIFIHDFILLSSEKNIYTWAHEEEIHSSDKREMSDIVKLFFEKSNKILYNSQFVKDVFSKFGFSEKSEVVPLIDIKVDYDYQNIPQIKGTGMLGFNHTVNIGIINNITPCKGYGIYPQIFNISNHRGFKIKYHVFGNIDINHKNVYNHGEYDENEIFALLEKNNIHGLLFFNKYPETYSYALTKGINSGLPIQYTNIGAYKERLESGHKKYFPCNGNEKEVFTKFLSFIINNSNKKHGLKPDNQLSVSAKVYQLFKKDVELYSVYFPQHVAIEENNKTFYKGYHDMKNLSTLYKDDDSVLIPERGFYTLTNDKIIEQHITQAKSYNISGFGIYWYWFDINTITGNNKILDSVIDRFFKKDIENFDIFLIWANESWSNNIAFNRYNNDEKIENTYSKRNLGKCCTALLKYFKHDNYKKINNKPLFYIHHPWEFPDVNIFIKMLDKRCVSNGFDGVEVHLNDISNPGNNICYSHSPNYKNMNNSYMKMQDNINVIDYEEYIKYEDGRCDDTRVLFQNFDNTARFYKHKDTNKIITKTVNNTIENFKKMIWVQTSSYDKKGIYMLNAWNEWGEGLCFEPSDKNGDILLKTINKML